MAAVTVEPDELTALIAATLAKAHAAPKASAAQLEARTPDFLPLAVQIRDALSGAGWLNDSEEQVIARRVLDMEEVRKLLRDTVARMVGMERERHVADGRAQEQLRAFNDLRGKTSD